MATFNIGKEFSDHPIGRFYSDGNGSGEEFREEYLRPALDKLANGEKLIVILDDGVEGYGSSFLVEGFAGIVKYGYMEVDALLDALSFTYEDEDFEFYKEKTIEYISEAKFKSVTYAPTEKVKD